MLTVEYLKKKYYSDEAYDGTLIFYRWIREYLGPNFVVLNVGAGRTAERKIRSLKGEVKKVVGIDIDPEVFKNTDLDEAFLSKNGRFPFPDNSFDLAWADYVLEHVEKPEIFLKGVYRVLKPGASFFFRTPNKYHYTSLITRTTPYWFHKLFVDYLHQFSSSAHRPYRTYFRLNSKRKIIEYAYIVGFKKAEIKFMELEPSYLLFHPLPFLLGIAYERLVNRFKYLSGIRANIFGRLEK